MQQSSLPQCEDHFERLLRKYLPDVRLHPLSQTEIPRLAKDRASLNAINRAIREIPTHHQLWLGDSRVITHLPDESVHLVVTSPPYFDLKRYPTHESQLGGLHDYEIFLKELDQVWAGCYRLLVEGGALIGVVGAGCGSAAA